MKTKQFTINGQVVTHDTKKGIPGLTVEAWDKDLLLDDFLGKATTGKEGNFTITFESSKFREFFTDQSPDLFFKVWKGRECIADTRNSMIRNATEHTTVVIPLNIPSGDGKTPDKKQIDYTVSGTVTLHDGRPAEAAVNVFGIGIASEQELAATKSNAKGRYEARFTAPANADLKVRAYVGETLFAESKTRYNAAPETVIDLTGTAQFRGPSEYTRLEAVIRPYLEGIDAKAMGTEEIKYLAEKTGAGAQHIALYAKAQDMATAELPSQFFYTLFRAGVRPEPAHVCRVNAHKATGMFKEVQGGLVPENGVDPEAIRQAFVKSSVREILATGNELSVSTMDGMLSLTLDTQDDKEKFVELYFHGDPGNDIDQTWDAVEAAFGKEKTDRLRLDGKLGYLTFNNAALIGKIKQETGSSSDLAGVALQGLYLEDTLEALIDDSVAVPGAMKGDNPGEKRASYIKWISGQLQAGYPNEVIAHQVDTGAIKVKNAGAVRQALTSGSGGFRLGEYSINQHIKDLQDSGARLSDETQKELQAIHRTYSLAPDLESMSFLMEKKLDSALKIVNYSEEQFRNLYTGQHKDEYSETKAMMIYNKALQDAGLITNMAVAYATQRVNIIPWIFTGFGKSADDAGEGIKAYPTMEKLFGSLDYCSCGHCRSVLSPAAYLVDLLQFIDPDNDAIEGINPATRLFDRRPDIQYAQLTCENTHTVLPYIDLVNEILEYYTVHHDIEGFEGYNSNGATSSEELLANPQFVNDTAYRKLNGELPGFKAAYPMALPFNRNLELLREFFAHFDTSLYQAMETFREDEALETNSSSYSWREILAEQLGLSPAVYELFTDSSAHSILSRYGISSGTLNETLANAKAFCKRTDIKYKELVELLKTEFINPAARHIVKLEALQQAFNTAKEDNDSVKDDYGATGLYTILHGIAQGDAGVVDNIDAIFPESEIDLDAFGGDLQQWIENTHDEIMKLIFLAPIDKNSGVCDFGNLELKYANPDDAALEDIEYWKFIHFIRLWKKMGWSITQTDRTLKALYDHNAFDISGGDLTRLDNGFKDFFVKLALFNRLRARLGLKSNKEYDRSLALWADINTYGEQSQYKELFLTATVLEINEVYREDGYGNYLADPSNKILDFGPSLQAAFSLTAGEWNLITTDTGFDSDSGLSPANISKVYRYGYLAKKLKISVGELIALKELSGINPFAAVTYKEGDDFRTIELLRFIDLVKQIAGSGFSVQDLKYLFRHVDETGNSQPSMTDNLSFAKTLYLGLKAIDDAYPTGEDLTETQAQTLVTAIYGQEYGNTMYSILGSTATFTTGYDHSGATLESAITDVTPKIGYDDFGKQLRFQGVMTLNQKNDLQAAGGVSPGFIAAVDALYDKSQAEYATFFTAHPEFKALYEAGNTFEDIVEGQFDPLVTELQRNYLKQTLAEALGPDVEFMEALLTGTLAAEGKYIMHSATQHTAPMIQDFLALGANGVSASYYNGAAAAGAPALEAIITSIAFDGEEMQLPANTSDPASNISASWKFYLETPTNTHYNLFLDTDAAQVSLRIDGEEIPMEQNGSQWSNTTALEFTAGAWYEVELQALDMHDTAVLKWQRREQLVETVPETQLFAYGSVQDYLVSYIKLLKAVRLIEGFALVRKEVEYFADDADMKFGDNSFLEMLPAKEAPAAATVEGFMERLKQLLNYTALRTQLNIDDASLIEVVSDPLLEDESETLRLLQLTGWEEQQLIPVIQRFTGEAGTDAAVLYPLLTDLSLFQKVADAYTLVKTIGVSAPDLFNRTTVAPAFEDCTHMQSAMRARYDRSSWPEVIQPISDRMRSRQRNALVSYILHEMAKHSETGHIDTPDKLYEFFLIDVEMSPCMKTSRIKQAISSTQLFVQRCLLNLENDVATSSINSEQWSWMKNYRVWEANRKVFLYPENWLDPSLRNTKSPFFKEFEGELLQSDINEDSAATALLNYLEKLDRVTQLSIYGMCREDENTLHVIGKIGGKSGEYYHRVYDGTWSSWEKIDLDIEDGPVIPVFWKNRLFLFWTTVLQKGQDNNQVQDEDLDNISNLNGPIRYRYEVNLCWSEYYNGKWQVKRTSDFDEPIVMETTNKNFTSKLRLRYYINNNEALDMFAVNDEFEVSGVFRLYNKHSEPLNEGYRDILYKILLSSDAFVRSVETSSSLGITYYDIENSGGDNDIPYIVLPNGTLAPVPLGEKKESIEHTLLGDSFYKITDLANLNIEEFADPMFVRDFKHLFFLEVEKKDYRLKRAPYGMEFPYGNIKPVKVNLLKRDQNA